MIRLTVIIITFLCMTQWKSYAQGNKMRLNGFGDMTFALPFGSPKDAKADSLFTNFGTDPFPVNVNKGFGLVGTDFLVTGTISDNITYQSEINLQVGRGLSDQFDLDVERMYLDYKITDKFGIQAGLFFTPIGFSNRNLYARAWLMNSIQIRDVVEEELNLAPTRGTGVNAYGTFDIGSNGHALKYVVSVTNGRGIEPTQVIYNRASGDNLEITGLLEWNLPYGDDFRIGLSGYNEHDIRTYRVDNYGEEAGKGDEIVKLQEVGFNPYIWYSSKKATFFLESHMISLIDKGRNLPKSTYNLFGISAELALPFYVKQKRLAPYIRYDYTDLPEEMGPYWGLRKSEGGVKKYYIPEFNAMMVGVSYDLSSFNRIKIEYINHFTGARQNAIIIQTGFGF